MKKSIIITLALVLVMSLALVGCGDDNGENGNGNDDGDGAAAEEIVIGVTPWTSTLIPSHIVNILLTDLGYDVTMQNADAGVVYAGLARGDINVFMDSWLPDTHADYWSEYGEDIDDVGVSYYEGELGIVVPSYLEDINSITDLIGKEDMFDGRVVGIDEGAGITKTTKEILEFYEDLDLEYVTSSEAAMMAQATRDIANEDPILFVGWRPHSMFALWDIKILEDEEEFFKTSEVHVLASTDLKDRAPEAHAFLSNWSISVGEIEQMILKIDQDDSLDPAVVAQEWIDNNQDKVNQMLGK